jgi:urea carboxylase
MSVEVVQPGIQTTVQDWPGRIGMLSRGYFPAGPMDDFAFRLGNVAVGNSPDAAGLEITLGKTKFRFRSPATVAVTGAAGDVTVDGSPVPRWAAVEVPAGAELKIGLAVSGFRFYLAVRGGIDVPQILGSRSTYTMGSLGGVEGRALVKGDVLDIGSSDTSAMAALPQEQIPEYLHDWELEVVPGPFATPEFVTEADVEYFFSRSWTVDQNSNRTGIRLDPARLQWARSDGGIAGGHPSNILDTGYPLGGINLNGDTPVILGPDGPTSGGFVVFGVVPKASLWKTGQMRPGTDTIRFKPISIDDAYALDKEHALLMSAAGGTE